MRTGLPGRDRRLSEQRLPVRPGRPDSRGARPLARGRRRGDDCPATKRGQDATARRCSLSGCICAGTPRGWAAGRGSASRSSGRRARGRGRSPGQLDQALVKEPYGAPRSTTSTFPSGASPHATRAPAGWRWRTRPWRTAASTSSLAATAFGSVLPATWVRSSGLCTPPIPRRQPGRRRALSTLAAARSTTATPPTAPART